MSAPPLDISQDSIDGTPGYWTGNLLSEAEMCVVREMIHGMFLSRVRELAPRLCEEVADLGLSRYHEYADLLDHAAAWSRHARLFSPQATSFIQSSSMMRKLKAALGSATITGEVEEAGPEIVWRLVRPGHDDDVGPLHADGWFWDINCWPVPAGMRRVKVWTMVHGEPGKAGLAVVPGSHREGPWPYRVDYRHGLHKPLFNTASLGDREVVLLRTPPGTSVVFNDGLLHGGAVTEGNVCRVSFEFTVFVPVPY